MEVLGGRTRYSEICRLYFSNNIVYLIQTLDMTYYFFSASKDDIYYILESNSSKKTNYGNIFL